MFEEYKDIELVCLCGKPFIWTVGEQTFMNQLKEDGKISAVQTPKRCQSCRVKHKEERARREGNFNREY